jgi:hypothetical protein
LASPNVKQLPQTTSVSLSSVGRYLVGLLTAVGGRQKVPNLLVAAEEGLFGI